MKSTHHWLQACCFVVAIPIFFSDVHAQLVPGTGTKLAQVGDDFEDEKWEWVPNGEKASREQDDRVRSPTGYSTNKRWFESPKRGMPDHIVRIATPPGGLPGSKGALKIQTLNSGIPGRPSGQMEQDDLIMSCSSRVGAISVARNPSCVTRVWLPSYDQWEKRSGSHFGYRIDLKTTISEKSKGFLFTKTERKQEDYWPGFFIEFHSKSDPKFKEDEAVLLVRGNNLGQEVTSLKLKPGWWTLGMSVTSDGRVHYYASEGVDQLTAKDHVYSSFPYGYEAEYFATHFYNSCNRYDGRTWSTPIVIDDPEIFVTR
ncbi:MAG: hypothetical protein JNL58_28760 [Planctomyces sp.]|nr:hypothetical protein [Planctomyces sp.]